MKLDDLLKKITPLPHVIVPRSVQRIAGNDHRTVAEFVAHGMTDAERQANRIYHTHCANTLPKLVEAMKELCESVEFGIFNSMSPEEIEQSPCHRTISLNLDAAESALKRAQEVKL